MAVRRQRSDLEDFRSRLKELRLVAGVQFEAMGSRLSQLTDKERTSQPDGAVRGSKNTFNAMVRPPLSVPPHPDLLRGYLYALGQPLEVRVEWEARRRDLALRLRRAEREPADPLQPPTEAEPEPEVEEVAATRRGRRLGWGIVALLLAAVAIVVLVLVTQRAGGGDVVVSGTVICVSGAEVSGIYIEAPRGEGFVRDQRATEDRSRSDFAYTLPSDTPYSVHVGCGTLPDGGWAKANWSDQVHGSGLVFTCVDNRIGFYGSCGAS